MTGVAAATLRPSRDSDSPPEGHREHLGAGMEQLGQLAVIVYLVVAVGIIIAPLMIWNQMAKANKKLDELLLRLTQVVGELRASRQDRDR